MVELMTIIFLVADIASRRAHAEALCGGCNAKLLQPKGLKKNVTAEEDLSVL